jgi:hypothetical protein
MEEMSIQGIQYDETQKNVAWEATVKHTFPNINIEPVLLPELVYFTAD